jgi:hypothetical protein
VKKIAGSSLAQEITKEDPRITKLRTKCSEQLVALRKAAQILGGVRDFSC